MRSQSKQEDTSRFARKRIGFWIAMLSMPVLFLALAEITLRVINYGGDLDLFVVRAKGSQREYVLNSNVSSRYFFRQGIRTPAPLSQTFDFEKDSLAYRIFCLGASTTQGFPYPASASYAAILRNILTSVVAEKKIEVINCGITAITSHSVLDMTREIVKRYEPDLLVVYTGHNEFYGALGQASRLSLFKSREMIEMFLKMQKSRLVLLLRNVIVRLFSDRVTRDSVIDHATLMGTLAKDASIPYESPLMQETERYFKENIAAIIETAHASGTQVVLSTLVSNLKDIEPFASLANEAEQENIASYISKGQKYFESNDFSSAADEYKEGLKIDSSNALMHYRLAQCYRALNEDSLARNHFRKARDYDVIRFRAPSSFNSILRDASEAYQVPLVDVEQIFDRMSPGNVTGHELILEHIHPNHQGYFVIAKSIAETMSRSGLIDGFWNWRNVKSDSAYLAMTHLTPLDKEVVNYTLFRLTSHWPFKVDPNRHYVRVGTELTESLAKSLIDDNEGSLVQLHLDLGLDYYNQGDLDGALREYESALTIEPTCETYSRIGLLYTRKTEIAYKSLKNYDAASENFQKALAYFDQGIAHCPDHVSLIFNQGLLYSLRNDGTAEALSAFERVLDLEPEHMNAMLQIGLLHIRRKEYEEAETIFLKAIALYPKAAQLHRNLGLAYARQQNLEKAEDSLNRAIQLKPNDSMAKHYLNQVRAIKRKQS